MRGSTGHWKNPLAAACLFAALALPVESMSADMNLVGNQIEITGDIKIGDYDKFEQIVEKSKLPRGTIVRLQSRGGRVGESVKIGFKIRRKHFRTYADKGACLSACALIWLAGQQRYRHPDSKLGFHQSYDGATKKAQGNAVVGYYLGELNYSYNTILFTTEASPSRLKLLTKKNAKTAEIQYETKVIDIFDLPLRRVPVPKHRQHADTVNLADGKSYSGELDAGMPNGYGLMVWRNSDRYDGDWMNGLQSGHGVFVSSGGEAYSGDWKRGRKHGSGEEFGPWGHYSGQFRNGHWHGNGILIASDGQRYRGGFKNGRANGKGSLEYSDTYRFSGQFRDGLFHGTGRLSNGGHQIYSGQWHKGLPHGSGKYRYPAGHTYDGAWKAGLRHGKGTFTFKDGTSVTGSWQYGLKHGTIDLSEFGNLPRAVEYHGGLPTLPTLATPEPTDSAWSVQLATRKSRAEAQATINSLRQRHAELFEERDFHVKKKTASKSGFSFRVYLSAETQKDARNFCRQLKDRGGSCFVAQN